MASMLVSRPLVRARAALEVLWRHLADESNDNVRSAL
jgi:hypothetical protein